MSIALLSDAPVTTSQIAGPALVDGSNLYVTAVDNYDPSTGNQLATGAQIHVFKSGDNGVTWTERDPNNVPSVLNGTYGVYGSPAIAPYFIIDTKIYFEYPVPGYNYPQILPFILGPGSTDGSGNESGNNTLQINLLEYGSVIQSASLVVNGIFGNTSDPDSVAAPLAAALNAQLAGLGIAPSVLNFMVNARLPSGIGTWGSTRIILSTSFTGVHWQIAVTGNMLSAFIPVVLGQAPLHVNGPFIPITIDTVTGVDPNINPVPVMFNTYGACISNHVIYIAYVGLDSTLNIARYNTLTDTWMSTVTGGPALTMVPYDSGLGANVPCTLVAEIKVRSTGAVVIAYAVGNSAAGSSADTYYTYWVVYNGSWGSASLITNSYVNTPVGSVIDASDNVIFFVGGPTWTSGTNNYVQTFIVPHTGSTVGPTPIDPSNSTAYITTGVRDQPQIKPPPVQAVIFSGHLTIAITYGAPSSAAVYMAEISIASLLSGGSWTIFSSPHYAAGVAQWFGAQSAIYWNGQYRVILCQTGSGSYSGSDGNGVLAMGSGNATGGGVDASWGAASTLVSLNNLPPILALSAKTIPYNVSAVLVGGALGLMYTFYEFLASSYGVPPYYFTRFMVLGSITASCNSPSSGSVGGPYAHTFTASGGTPPYTWAVTSGALPTGLTLNSSSGVASGIPSAAGTFSFGLTVTDSLGFTASVSCSIAIGSPFRAICNATNSTVGTSYSQTITTVGGVSAFTFALIMGALPAGTTLNTSTGVISGTLTTPGRYFYTIQVTDSTGSVAFATCQQQTCPS